MGQYVVNGEIVDVRSARPTALELKEANNSVVSDWVMATMPDGTVQKLSDSDNLPAAATDFAVVTPYQYGGH